ncbi:CRM-domain containing factor CFM3, chloroplastic/mitochondrial [Euphorbia lathyris]|uniref:CRM-domain containing factor CFM3, chloroplastic/mitochondrial n=1 Tax=Euphorbia lathyris TaxID=212925 RepID=UPI0033130D13
MDMALLLPTSNLSLYPLLLQTKHSSACIASNFTISCSSGRSIQVNAAKTTRKPRPNFSEQIRHKWSLKVPSTREKFPWEERKLLQQQEEKEEEDIERRQNSRMVDATPTVDDDPVSTRVSNPVSRPPWIHGTKPRIANFGSQSKNRENVDLNEENAGYAVVDKAKKLEKEVNFNTKFGEKDNVLHVNDDTENPDKELNYNVKFIDENVKFGAVPVKLLRDKETARVGDSRGAVSLNKREHRSIVVSDDKNGSSIQLPWKREKKVDNVVRDLGMKKSDRDLADKILPEHELKRLRNVSLRMFERSKVGAAGITQDLVDTIHKKWRLEEVVKLKFEEPFSSNMKRTHEMLESRTGGLVIWRSGSSVVLYRGLSYKLQCVQSFSEQNVASKDSFSHPKQVASNRGVKDSIGTIEPIIPDCAKYLKDLSKEEFTEFSELNQLLDELGPRFTDWCGREPFPIDADLLPGINPEYKPPLRLLPHGVRHCLTNKEMTIFRRVARTMPPHFALGRNRELQGLAMAMVKLWEKTAIAKIAIKRGVLNTRNERMAEELRVLTGGTLLSRNKEFIVFYRGNDFLPPAIMGNLRERKKLTYLKQDEEEQARKKALTFISSHEKTSQSEGPLVAGTLTETMAATTRWSIQHGSEEVDKMRREASLARRASLIRNLQNRLALAKGKMTKAEKGLAKVQQHMEPSGLPSDLETISNEERFLFRKIGLSMKPYLLLGRRGVYDGTIENMHLHWKYREIVKVMVSRKSLPQVKHIATSLETESGGILVSVEKTSKGYAIIIYRGKNYQRPNEMRPANLLTKRQALARSIELQRREALKHHISDLQERIELMKSELEEETESGEKISVNDSSNR